MDLQNTFYIVGIIAMTLYTLLLVAVVIILLIIKKKINNVTSEIERKINEVRNIADMGTVVADTALNKAADFLKSRKK